MRRASRGFGPMVVVAREVGSLAPFSCCHFLSHIFHQWKECMWVGACFKESIIFQRLTSRFRALHCFQFLGQEKGHLCIGLFPPDPGKQLLHVLILRSPPALLSWREFHEVSWALQQDISDSEISCKNGYNACERRCFSCIPVSGLLPDAGHNGP